MSKSACWPGRSSRSGHAREEEPTPLTTKLEQMLTQLGSFPGASAAWFQLTVTLTHAFGPGEQKCPHLLAGLESSASKGGVPPCGQRQRRNWFPRESGVGSAKADLASNREAEVRSAALAPLVHFAEQNF
jgi:hypothetical protein